ncbi:MAG: hypothetical protein H6737_07455 [Alphaproteobacteria bacterium]|nr:hypothetical protein [Alphaproteobacteria bacterium]
MQKIIDLWNKIPRDKEWWLDQFAAIMTGCFTGCATITVCYLLSVAVSVAACFVVAKNFNEALTMGLAWGSTLGMLVVMVFGSAVLSVISWLRGA